MILIIDNYDSFTYNLVQMVEEKYHEVIIAKNDDDIDRLLQLNPKGLIISPGPCTPKESGICMPLIQHFHDKIPVLGICLGHQCIAEVFEGQVVHARNIFHGVVDKISHDYQGLFTSLEQGFNATRYHSLIVSDHGFPKSFLVTARSKEDGYIMGMRHQHYPVEGLQFHPESYKTEVGEVIIQNFIDLVRTGGYHV